MYLKIIISLLSLSLLLGCTDNFETDQKQIESILIIEGHIDNTGEPVEIKLSETLAGSDENDYFEYAHCSLKYIIKAIVIISSNNQPGDTLFPDSNSYSFKSTKIKGIIGETYLLKVIYKDNIYEASAYMPSCPTLDSISFTRKQIEKENANLYVPMANFTDPANEENYYLFRDAYINTDTLGVEHWQIRYGDNPWMISLFSDRFINGKTTALNVREGITVSEYWRDGNFWSNPGDQVAIQMESITRETYDYYLALINQLKYASGVFHPAPANAPTNISNGGQGFFYAASVSRKATVIPDLGSKYE